MKLKNQLIAFGASLALASSAFALTTVTSDITTNTVWTSAGNPYILSHVIKVKSGATLDIGPGVIIRGEPRETGVLQDAGSLVVTPTGRIQARGTAAAPIIFTTAATFNAGTHTISRYDSSTGDPFLDADPVNAPLPSLMDLDGVDQGTDGNFLDDKVVRLWGGLILEGESLTNNYEDVDGDTVPESGVGLPEGLTGPDVIYGGGDAQDDSGIVEYVSLRHGGDGVVADKEINALTLYAVGSGTSVRYIDVYCTSDDAIEVFGGTVNMDHLCLTYSDDDGLDNDEGYQGTVQYVFVLQGNTYGDSGMELDGDDWDEGQAIAPLYPISDVRIYNATVVKEPGTPGSRAIRMRNGFNGMLINSILYYAAGSPGGSGVNIEGDNGDGDMAPFASTHFDDGDLRIMNVTAWNFSTYYSVAAIAGGVDMSATGAVTGTYKGLSLPNVFYPAANNRGSASAAFNPGLSITSHTAVNGINPVPTGGPGGVGSTQGADYVTSPALFTTYRGAFNPSVGSQWTLGWTALNKRGVLAN